MPDTSMTALLRGAPVTLKQPPHKRAQRPEGERLERPLATVPYPVEACHGVCLDSRDVEAEEDAVRYRTGRW